MLSFFLLSNFSIWNENISSIFTQSYSRAVKKHSSASQGFTLCVYKEEQKNLSFVYMEGVFSNVEHDQSK